MPAVRPPQAERRRDPRFALRGSVRIVVRQPLVAVEAALLDVSAGGLRCSLPAGTSPASGESVEVEVTIRETSDPARPPTIHLRGAGDVVRRLPAAQGSAELAIHLTGPLGFRDYFSQVRVY